MTPQWIWLKNRPEVEKDYYAGFKSSFKRTGSGRVLLNLSCDSIFAAYINGELVGFSACADYPHYKLYDEMDITEYCKDENELYVIVWHLGDISQTYFPAPAGLWFEILEDGKPICVSSEETKSRLEHNFVSGLRRMITIQLGFTFKYDNTLVNTDEYIESVKIEKMIPTKRPQKNLVLSERAPVVYSEREGYLLVDMGREVAGYPDLEFDSPCEQEVLITFGEHLNFGGRVLREVGGRDFSFNIKARKGKNSFFCPLRRLAGRYFEVISDTPISATYIGMRPVDYPVTEIKKEYESDLVKRIYETSVRTLRLCMHEHYEDCPWREQALYALDSRNQMLFGYHAFRETEYPRANLLLMSKGLRPDGLLPICYPAGRDVPIPFFSLAYILEVCEYVEYTGDRTLLDEVDGVMKTIIETFTKKIDETGLIARLPYPYWNFYEWSPGSSARPDMARKAEDPYHKDYEIILNAFYVYVVNIYNKTTGADYKTDAVKKAIHDTFYVASDGLYKLSCENGAYSQLANSFAALIGLGGDALLRKIAACEGNMIPATLSMKPFFYDALLTDKDGYSQFVLDDIKRVYKNMLDDGATSFWETELGWVDFNNAGSLCHGWSAAPVYYFSILGAIKNAE